MENSIMQFQEYAKMIAGTWYAEELDETLHFELNLKYGYPAKLEMILKGVPSEISYELGIHPESKVWYFDMGYNIERPTCIIKELTNQTMILSPLKREIEWVYQKMQNNGIG